jgi:hypothetical protein
MRRSRLLVRTVRSNGPVIFMALCSWIFVGSPEIQAADLVGIQAARLAINDLVATFGERYPAGRQYLANLGRIEQQSQAADAAKMTELQAEVERLRREALLANPLLRGQPLLFVVRPQYAPDHHNTETMFQTGEINTGSFRGGGALKRIDLRQLGRTAGSADQGKESAGVSTVIYEVPKGLVRDPEISFDGKKILFSMRRDASDDYHLYEINADGTDLKQLTFGCGVTDIDPIYLPNGQILCTSTREPKYCMCNRHIMGNLFTMDADGANIQQIGHSTLHEGHASLLPDGRVIYDRWEYVDRNFGNAQGLWTTNPDGTNHVVYYGNSTESPGAKLEARVIPGTEQVICTFSSCHDRPWGALAILDRRLGVDGRGPVVRTWPASAINLVDHGGFDTFSGVYPKYQNPCPLSEKHFLCSRMTGQGERMGVYLLDVFGNEILVHVEGPGCFNARPLTGRLRPPAIPSRVDLSKKEGYFYVSNVYVGTGMEKIPRGTVKQIRVVESPEKRFWTNPGWDGGTGQQAPGMAWNDFNNKAIVGTAPVEADGSAHFAVPADKFVYFQLLDEKGMLVHSMRSGTIARPGEHAGCIGCHEYRLGTVASNSLPLAMRRGPSKLKAWYGPPRNFGYLTEVQPAFDRSCVSCHDYGKEAGKKLNLAGDINACFNTSYVELRSRGYVQVVGAGPPQVLMPMTWGSPVSRLTKTLLQGHGKPEIDREVKLSHEDFDRIVTWIDLNAPYYPEYAGGSYRDHTFGRCPLNGEQVHKLSSLTGVDIAQNMLQASFTRPELSPCLARIPDKNDSRYKEALAILTAGKEALAKHPRPDMAGFALDNPLEIEQQRKFDMLRQAEANSRAAIVAGQKIHQRREAGDSLK